MIPPTVRANNVKWTFMVYMDADNNLDPAGVDDISEMQAVGSTSEVNVIVLFDRWHEACGFNGSAILYIHEGWNEIVWGGWSDEYEVNMGDPETLTWFINYSAENYPADKYALIIWDHGGNWEGVCWDWTDEDYLTIKDLYEALLSSPVTINLLGFDACLMSSIEVSYELQLSNKVKVMTASEDFVPWAGYPYDMILQGLTQYPEWDENTLATYIVDKYVESYANLGVNRIFATLAAINLSNIGTLVEYSKYLTCELIMHFDNYKNSITGAKNSADRYWFGFWHQGPYIDLHQFVYRLGIIETGLKEYTDVILKTWNNVVIHSKCCTGPHIKSGAGLTIYFPRNSKLFYTPEAYYESVTAFAEYTGWYTLLTMYFA